MVPDVRGLPAPFREHRDGVQPDRCLGDQAVGETHDDGRGDDLSCRRDPGGGQGSEYPEVTPLPSAPSGRPPDITAGRVRCWSSQHVTIPAWTRSWSAPDSLPARPAGVPSGLREATATGNRSRRRWEGPPRSAIPRGPRPEEVRRIMDRQILIT